jgi:hypothetical protein
LRRQRGIPPAAYQAGLWPVDLAPEGFPLEEDELVKALCNLLTKGFLRDFAALLDPVEPSVVEPAQST